LESGSGRIEEATRQRRATTTEAREERIGARRLDVTDAQLWPGSRREHDTATARDRGRDAPEREVDREARGRDDQSRAEQGGRGRPHSVDERADADVAPDDQREQARVQRRPRESRLALGARQPRPREHDVALAQRGPEEKHPPANPHVASRCERELPRPPIRERHAAEDLHHPLEQEKPGDSEHGGGDDTTGRGGHFSRDRVHRLADLARFEHTLQFGVVDTGDQCRRLLRGRGRARRGEGHGAHQGLTPAE
jgi:hypothetical protein